MKTATKTTARTNPLLRSGMALAQGFDPSMLSGDHFQKIKIADIEQPEQVRTEQFEDSEQQLRDLGESLRKRQAHNIVVRPNPKGSKHPYRLVVGGRRVRAAELVGMTELWALVAQMTDDEAEELQLTENIHRLNLSHMDEARRLKRDYDQLGTYEAVLAKHNKQQAGKGWLSKLLALLELGPVASEVVANSVSADTEVITGIARLEKESPELAKEVVKTLTEAPRGKVNARKEVAKAKAKLDASKPAKPAKSPKAAAVAPKQAASQPTETLARAYTAVYEGRSRPRAVIDGLGAEERRDAETWLLASFEAGKKSRDPAKEVFDGLHVTGAFATDGDGLLCLMAFLHGVSSKAKTSLLDTLNIVAQ